MRWIFLLLVLVGCASNAQLEGSFDGCFQPSDVQRQKSESKVCFQNTSGSWKQEHRQSDFGIDFWKPNKSIAEFLVNHAELNAHCISPDMGPYRLCRVKSNIEIQTVGNFSGNRIKSRSGYVLVRSTIHHIDRFVVEEYSKLN